METNQFSTRAVRNVGEWLIYLTVLLVPIFSLPLTALPLAFNKSYLAYFLLILAAMLYLVYTLKHGRIVLPKSLIYVFLLLFALVAAVSGAFSSAKGASFFGVGHEPYTVSAVALFAAALIFSSLLLDGGKQWKRAFLFLYASFLILFLFQAAVLISGSSFLPWLEDRITANLFGSWNEFGVFAGFVALFAFLNFDRTERGFFKIVSAVTLAAALLAALFVNFEIVWWVLGAFLVVYLSYLYSHRRQPQMSLRFSFFILLVAVFAILSRTLIAEAVTRMGAEFVEIRPSWQATGEVMKGVFKESLWLGSGPNTFLYDWFMHRPQSITATAFWQARFASGVGFLPTWVATTGMAGFLSLALFLLWYLWSGFKALMRKDDDASPLLVSTFFGALYLWTFAVIYPLSFTAVLFAFLMTGAFISLAAQAGIIKTFDLSLFEKSGIGFLAALVMIFLVILSASWLYTLSQKYAGAYFYAEGVEAARRGNYDRASLLLTTALKFDRQDFYYRGFTDIDLIKLSQLIGRRDLPQEKLRLELQTSLSTLIEHAQQAKDANPADPINWSNLGRAYESIVSIGVAGAADFAKAAYQEALNRFPQNPEPLLSSARVELAQRKTQEVKIFLTKAIEIKKDYAEAHFLLAQIEVLAGNLDKAIQSAETAAILLPNDIGTLFQLGLLYYQKENFDDARVVLERAVSLNVNYSNARYFLGLIYARGGDKERALAEFRKILELNPGNQEISAIIANLEQDRAPLAGISPPAPEPEKRPKPPVEEQSRQ